MEGLAPPDNRTVIEAGGKKRHVLRTTFLKGLAALLPAVLTIFIIVKAVQFINAYIARPITKLPVLILRKTNADPEVVKIFGELASNGAIRVLAFLLAVVMVCLLGALLLRAVGRKLWAYFEASMGRVPLVNQIYPRIKQLVDFLFSDHPVRNEYRAVVAVEYPRKGVYSIGFLTGRGLPEVDERTGRQMVTVFVPSSPTPLTGYIVFAPASELIRLSLTPEQVLPMLISGGVIVPVPKERLQEGGIPPNVGTNCQ